MTWDEGWWVEIDASPEFIWVGGTGAVREYRVRESEMILEVDVSRIPNYLPNVRLKDRRKYPPLLPHVSPDGTICVVQDEVTVFDPERLAEVVLKTAQLALNIVEAGLNGTNKHEVLTEIQDYWATSIERGRYLCFFEVDDMPRRIQCVRDPKNDLFGELRETSDDRTNNRKWKGHDVSAWYLPLPDGDFLSDLPLQDGLGFKDLQKIMRRIDLTALRGESAPKKRNVLIFGVPMKDGTRVLVGTFLTWNKKGAAQCNPLFDEEAHYSLKHFVVDRRDSKYLIQRGGGYPDLVTKRVMVVGVGSVGSLVADLFAKAGVGQLSLVDPDCFQAENSHRYGIGGGIQGELKVGLVRKRLLRDFPHLEVETHHGTIASLLARQPAKVLEHDLVVCATGNHNVEMNLLREVKEQGPLPMISTWLEPHGIGGHAILYNANSSSGCLACLYYQEGGEFSNAAAFALQGQSYARVLGGCASTYVVYGGVHAMKTASQAVQLALDFLLGREYGYPLRSWKGSAEEFEQLGFKLSERYQKFSQTELDRAQYSYQSTSCPMCRISHKQSVSFGLEKVG